MRIKKALHGYYREQINSVVVADRVPAMKQKEGGRRTWIFSFAFHFALFGIIVAALISGYYQPSRLEERMYTIVDSYKIEDRMISSLDDLKTILKK